MYATVPSLALVVEDDQLQRDFLSDVPKSRISMSSSAIAPKPEKSLSLDAEPSWHC